MKPSVSCGGSAGGEAYRLAGGHLLAEQMSVCTPDGWLICDQQRWTGWSAPEPGTSPPVSLPASCSPAHDLARRASNGEQAKQY